MDDINWAILEILQKDARISFADLGKQVGLSAPAVAERVKRMEAEEIIIRYAALLNPKKLGFGMEVFLRIAISGPNLAKLEKWAHTTPNVMSCWHVTGQDCYVARVLIRDILELEKFLLELNTFGTTNTAICLSKPIERGIVRPVK